MARSALSAGRNDLRRGEHKGKAVAKLKDATRARLERLGRERRLIYMTFVLTGLRRGELAALSWGDLDLSDAQAWLTLPARVAKNRKADTIPVRADLATELRHWRKACGAPPDAALVFKVPHGLVHILRRDLRAAGIDEEGVDVHSLRHTMATHLEKAGVTPRTAQMLLRHSDIRLTLGRYTDPRLLDTAAAVEALPTFSRPPKTEPLRATGTCDDAADALGGLLGGKVRPAEHRVARTCSDADHAVGRAADAQRVVAARVSNKMQRDSRQRATRLERATFSLEG